MPSSVSVSSKTACFIVVGFFLFFGKKRRKEGQRGDSGFYFGGQWIDWKVGMRERNTMTRIKMMIARHTRIMICF